MNQKIEKQDWVFLLLCLLIGLLAEESFFRERIGVSFFVFIVFFYAVFFWRFRSFPFSHQRFGYLILIAVWVLASGYYLYDTILFYLLNIVVIPALVIFHLALITSPKYIQWNRLFFFLYTFLRLISGLRYSTIFTKHITASMVQRGSGNRSTILKKVLLGCAISIPFLLIILNLLTSADAQFERLLMGIPDLVHFNPEYLIRFILILVITFCLFGYMQSLLYKYIPKQEQKASVPSISLDGIVTLTVLLLLNLVYILFVAVQFKYFFSGTLGGGYTYAEYARRGFFELLFVTLINLSVITAVILWAKTGLRFLKKAINFSLTILVLASGVMLVSAFMRLAMYEEAYGFTFSRVLAHSFMIFLMVIFAYTLVKIWLQKLSLFHFYFIAALIYYTGMNVVNIDRFVVKENIALYEETGKIDLYYLNRMSASGVLGLIELYEKHPDVPGLEDMLKKRKKESAYLKSNTWQSYNITRNSAYEKLKKLDL